MDALLAFWPGLQVIPFEHKRNQLKMLESLSHGKECFVVLLILFIGI